jgi:hypothetical protein
MLKLIPRPAAAVALACFLAGVILFPLTESATGDTIAFVLLGLGSILLSALAFYVVGRSEDVERERERRSRNT